MSSLLDMVENVPTLPEEEKSEYERQTMFDRALTANLGFIFEILDKLNLTIPRDFSSDDEKEEDVIKLYKISLRIDITYLYYSFFMQKVDLNIWQEFIESKDFLSEKKVSEFLKNYSIKIINDILSDKDLTEFEKERKLRDECAVDIKYLNYKMKSIYLELLSFELNEWKFFAKHFETWRRSGYSEERMIMATTSWSSITKFHYPEKYKTITNMTTREHVGVGRRHQAARRARAQRQRGLPAPRGRRAVAPRD